MDAFAEAFEGLRATVFSVACRIVGPLDAEDVVMETFLKAWQALPRFQGRSSLRTWLFRIARNCALDVIRRRQRRREQPLEAGGNGGTVAREWPDETRETPDALVARSESQRELLAALAQLSTEHRTALELRFADGLSYAEIAAATGVSIGTVMSRLFNGKRKLRRMLTP